MANATINEYFKKGFPNDPILQDVSMIVRTDVESVREVVHACLKPEKSPLIQSDLAQKLGIDSFL